MGVLGKANIGGVLRNLTGEGYVNIGGVLRPITIGNLNIGGVLRESGGYKWKKYNTVTSTYYVEKEEASICGFNSKGAYNLFSTKSFDPTNGSFSLSGMYRASTGSAVISYYKNYPYYKDIDYNIHRLNSRAGQTTTENGTFYQYNSSKLFSELVTDYSQGTYIEDVTSPDETAYPENGRHTDGYWYVKQ